MSKIEIPLLRESAAFVQRLMLASHWFGDTQYHFHRRVNWTYRYDTHFYDLEADYFKADPDAYLAQEKLAAPQVLDVFAQKLHPKQIINVLLKVLAHWLFRLLGGILNRSNSPKNELTYRKCYVDDIELVYDPLEPAVLRAVYPFPLNTRRQFRYLRFLFSKGYSFKLTGHAYRAGDVLRFIARRDVRSLQRLETRAQVRHAHQVLAQGFKTVQLSDEFDIGSLDFARTLSRLSVQVTNSAHGVGKYFPVHAYQEFYILTERQKQYYHAARPCSYKMRTLNERKTDLAQKPSEKECVRLIWLSQVFESAGAIIGDEEKKIIACLGDALTSKVGIELYYKAHPNSTSATPPVGFKLITSLAEVNGRKGTVFASFFSTCQIDPAFKGNKVLIKSHLICPQISFDQAENILSCDDLLSFLLAQYQARRYQDSTGVRNE
jgi:hypothetical protein